MAKQSDQYSEREANQRFMAALKAAVNAPPKPLKDIPKKTGESRGITVLKKRRK